MADIEVYEIKNEIRIENKIENKTESITLQARILPNDLMGITNFIVIKKTLFYFGLSSLQQVSMHQWDLEKKMDVGENKVFEVLSKKGVFFSAANETTIWVSTQFGEIYSIDIDTRNIKLYFKHEYPGVDVYGIQLKGNIMIALFDDGGDVLVWNITNPDVRKHKIIQENIFQECNHILLQGNLFIYNTGCFICVMKVENTFFKDIRFKKPYLLSGNYLHNVIRMDCNSKYIAAATENSILFLVRILTDSESSASL